MMEISRLSSSLESLAYAALGREGPRSAAARSRRRDHERGDRDADRVDQHVDRRAVAPVHERLVELVGGGVEEADRHRDCGQRTGAPSARSARHHERRSAYSVTWASLRSSDVPPARGPLVARLAGEQEDQRHHGERRQQQRCEARGREGGVWVINRLCRR